MTKADTYLRTDVRFTSCGWRRGVRQRRALADGTVAGDVAGARTSVRPGTRSNAGSRASAGSSAHAIGPGQTGHHDHAESGAVEQHADRGLQPPEHLAVRPDPRRTAAGRGSPSATAPTRSTAPRPARAPASASCSRRARRHRSGHGGAAPTRRSTARRRRFRGLMTPGIGLMWPDRRSGSRHGKEVPKTSRNTASSTVFPPSEGRTVAISREFTGTPLAQPLMRERYLRKTRLRRPQPRFSLALRTPPARMCRPA